MRLPGYCISCHRPRHVQVSGHALAGLAFSGVAQGVCDECSDPKCPHCDGVGAMAGAHTERVNPCPYCHGTGGRR